MFRYRSLISISPTKTGMVIFLLFILANCSGGGTSKTVIGEWAFEKFSFPNDEFSMEKLIVDANKANRGLTLIFTRDNQFISKQPNGTQVNNSKTWYKIINDGKTLVIDGDTSQFLIINNESLQLTHPDRPILTLKRIQ